MASQSAVPITAPPQADQLVEHNGRTYTTVREGLAYILVPPNARCETNPQDRSKPDEKGEQRQSVFYNPIQQFNRDLSVLAIKAFSEDLCARRKLEGEGRKQKKDFKRDRKVRKKEKRPREEDDGQVEAKRRKSNDGEVMVAENGATKEPLDRNGVDLVQNDAEIEDDSEIFNKDGAMLEDGGVSLLETENNAIPISTIPNEADVTQQWNDSKKQTVLKGTDFKVNEEITATNGPAKPAWQPKFRILDALSATGLRALRYALEIAAATSITAVDMSPAAVASIGLNVQHNQLSSKIMPITANALGHMYSVAFQPASAHGPDCVSQRYDVVDLDPYGTAAPFIDAALHALNDGGLLCVTCTDSGVFASCGYSEKTYALYGGLPVKGPYSHEAGLRLIIHSVATAAAKNGITIEPLLSLSIDFYSRIFIRIRKSPADVKFLAGKTMAVYCCDAGCGAWSTQLLARNVEHKGKDDQVVFKHSLAQGPSADRFCEHCASKTHLAGPMWAGPLHNAVFVERLLAEVENASKEVYATTDRLEGMLKTALDELTVNHTDDLAMSDGINAGKEARGHFVPHTPPQTLDHHPFFFIPSALAKVIHCQAPPEAAVKGALRHAGYRATRSHCKPGSIKTDAPWVVIWEVMREWVRQKCPIKEGAVKENTPGWRILQAARSGDEVDGTPDADTGAGASAGQGDCSSAEFVLDVEEPARELVSAQPSKIKIVFDEVLGKDKPGKRVLRYQMNPRANWGPMNKAKGSTG